MNTLYIAGVVLLAILAIGFILTRLYRRATKDQALVRTGMGGEKIVINGGVLIIPVLHESQTVRLSTVKLEVKRIEQDALITKDKLRIDVAGLFHIKVKPNVESIAAAAQTLGNRVNNDDAVRELLEGKLVSALRSVAATMEIEELHSNRQEFINKVQDAVQSDLDTNGFQLESISITQLDQTNVGHLNEQNIFDAEGLTKIRQITEDRRRQRNDIEAENRVAIEQRNFEANQKTLEIKRQDEFARLEQEKAVAETTAQQEATIARAKAESEREQEEARIQKEQGIRAAEIARDRELEVQRIQTQVETQKKSEEESIATAAANEARAKAVVAEESVATARAEQIAERERTTAMIKARQEADQQAVRITTSANAEREAAQARAEAKRIEAEADAKAKELEAQGVKAMNDVRASGERDFNEAANLLSPEQIDLEARRLLLQALPEIIEQSVKPLEKIEGIQIYDVRGMPGAGLATTGDGGYGGAANQSLPNEAVNAALRHRVAAPLIDKLMGQIGLSGSTIDGLLGAATHQAGPETSSASQDNRRPLDEPNKTEAKRAEQEKLDNYQVTTERKLRPDREASLYGPSSTNPYRP